MKYDYLIVGGGLSGLVCGIILAKEQKKVIILEQHNKPGGYLHSFYRHSHQFETGFHFVPMLRDDQILSMYWKYLGILDKLELVPYNKKHFQTLIFPHEKIDLPIGIEDLFNLLCETFPDEAQIIKRFILKIEEISRCFSFFNKNHTGNYKNEYESFQIITSDFLDSLKPSIKLKSVLFAHSFLYGLPPKETPLGIYSIFFNALYASLYDIKGGGDALCSALVTSLKECGGDILYNKKVSFIKTKDNKIIGAETEDKSFYYTENIIYSPNPQNVFQLFDVDVFRKKYINKINTMENTYSHFGAYIITKADMSKYHYDLFYLPSYDIDSLFSNPVSKFPNEYFLYVTIPTTRIGMSKGKHIIEAIALDNWENYYRWKESKTGKRPYDYYIFKEKILSKLIEKLKELIPELINAIIYKEASTPLTNNHFTLSPKGSMFGIKHNINQMISPISPKTSLQGFYLTGQSLIIPGILGVTITSFITCSVILGKKYLFDRICSEILKQ